jgi:hypothetical protein
MKNIHLLQQYDLINGVFDEMMVTAIHPKHPRKRIESG